MKLDDVFKTDKCITDLSEDITVNGQISNTSGHMYMRKMHDLFKVDGVTPEEAVKQVILILLASKSKTAKVYMNGVLQGGTKAGIKIDYILRKSAERFIDEGVITDLSISEHESDIRYDQISGLGAVHYNQDISHFGSEVYMTPSKFLSLVPRYRQSDDQFIFNHIKSNKSIASPWLFIRFGDSSSGKTSENSYIIGHDGSRRVKAIYDLFGDIPMIVHLIYSGCRSHDISHTILNSTNNGLTAEKGSYVVGPFWESHIVLDAK